MISLAAVGSFFAPRAARSGRAPRRAVGPLAAEGPEEWLAREEPSDESAGGGFADLFSNHDLSSDGSGGQDPAERERAETAENEAMEAFFAELENPPRGGRDGNAAWLKSGRRPPPARPRQAPPPMGAKALYDSASGAPMAERRPPPQFSSTRSQQSDGLEAAELGGRLVALTPTKVMVFVDGTWLYYTLFERGKRCPIVKQFGAGWYENHYIDFGKIPEIISDHLSAELLRYAPNSQRAVEVVRVLVFSSFREEQEVSSQRQQMFRAMQKINFEVHLGSFTGPQEKCVDIALAVDMLHYATVPDAFDVAVLLSGDRDFIPALLRTRQKGKRVAICSMRNSASYEFEDPAAHIKDFGVLWLDDRLGELVTPVHPSLLRQRPAMEAWLRGVLVDAVGAAGGAASAHALQAELAELALGESSALQYLGHEYGSLREFAKLFPDDIEVRPATSAASGGYVVALAAGNAAALMGGGGGGGATVAEVEDALAGLEALAGGLSADPGSDDGVWRDLSAEAAASASAEAGLDASAGLDAGAAAKPPLAEQLLDILDEEAEMANGNGGGGGELSGELSDLAQLTVPQLKEALRARQLPIVGTKAALIRRLADDRAAAVEAPE